MGQPIHTKLLFPPNNMRHKTFVRGFAILAVAGLVLGALLPVFASL